MLYAHSTRMPPPAVGNARSAGRRQRAVVMSLPIASRIIVRAAVEVLFFRPVSVLNARTPKLQVPG